MLFTDVRPRAFRSSVRLFACRPCDVPARNAVAENRSPPSLLMMFTWAPPVEYSADPPEPASMTISSAPRGLMKKVRPFGLSSMLYDIPFCCMRWSACRAP